MPFLNASLQKQLGDVFGALPRPVTLLVFVRATDREPPCETCEETRELVEELASISEGKIRVETRDLDRHAAEATLYGIDKVPALVVVGPGNQLGIRFFGAPSGYEFATLIEDIRMASTGTTDLAESTLELLSRLTAPLHLKVFVTPTCPYCPRAVLLAHKMAMASDWVTSDAIDATEFPEIAAHYRVHGVPRTIANDVIHVEGAVPEAMLMARLSPILVKAPPAA